MFVFYRVFEEGKNVDFHYLKKFSMTSISFLALPEFTNFLSS